MEALFAHCLTIKDIAQLLYEYGLIYMLFQNVSNLLDSEKDDPEFLSY